MLATLPPSEDKTHRDSQLTVVIDSNVYVSCLLGSDAASRTLQTIHANYPTAISQQILDELCRFIDDNWKKARGFKKIVRTILPEKATHFIDTDQFEVDAQKVRDAKDHHIIKLCVIASADLLITGDKDLTSLGTFGGTVVLTMTEFLEFSDQQ